MLAAAVLLASLLLLLAIGGVDSDGAALSNHDVLADNAADSVAPLRDPSPATSPRSVPPSTPDGVTSRAAVEEVGHPQVPRRPITVRLRVRRIAHDSPGEALPGAAIAYVRRGARGYSTVPLGIADEEGRLEAQLPYRGLYRFEVDPKSLPADVHPPMRLRMDGPSWRGISRQEAVVESGDQLDLTLWCQESRTLSGRVLGPGGTPTVRTKLQAYVAGDGWESLTQEITCDESGRFEFTNLLPMEYWLRILHARIPEEDQETTPLLGLPPPLRVDLRAESVRTLSIIAESGTFSVFGRVVDELGSPFPGIFVTASYFEPKVAESKYINRQLHIPQGLRLGSSETDELGRFRIEGIHRSPFHVLIGSEAVGRRRSDGRLLAWGPDVIQIAPTSYQTSELDLGEIRLHRSHSYELKGKLELTADRLNSKRLSLNRVVLEAIATGPKSAGESKWGFQTRPYVRFNKESGTFVISSDTPRDLLTVRVHRAGMEGTLKEFEFRPSPGVKDSGVVLQFP